MKAGKELDKLIGVKIMGWKGNYWLPEYSIQIQDAWEVVEKMERWKFTLTYNQWEEKKYYTAIFDPVLIERRDSLMAQSMSAPHAICLAALKSVGYKDIDQS